MQVLQCVLQCVRVSLVFVAGLLILLPAHALSLFLAHTLPRSGGVCVHVNIYIYVYIYICMYVFTYIHM